METEFNKPQKMENKDNIQAKADIWFKSMENSGYTRHDVFEAGFKIAKSQKSKESELVEKWISVEKEFPENYEYVLGYNENSGVDVYQFKHGLFYFNLNIILNITHWMPLPEKPKTK